MRKTYREIFIFVAGSTPQIITETICALATKKPPVIPDELYIVTTAKGRATIEKTLLKSGVLEKISEEYALPDLTIKDSSFIVPCDPAGLPLDDIRSAAENELIGDCITALVRGKTARDYTRLHCSLAGGRKTMAFYMGAAMQLFGRPWDRLYHVLVTPDFESCQGFYYKPLKDMMIEHNSRVLNTKDAVVDLVELPFIRLREKLSLKLESFRQLVVDGQKEIDIALSQPELRVSLSERSIYIGDTEIKLQPLHIVLYTVYLKRKLQQCKYPDRPYCRDCADCFPQIVELTTKPALEEMAKDYMIAMPSRVSDLLHKHKDGLTQEFIRQTVSKIKKTFSDSLQDEGLTALYAITTAGKAYANTRYGIKAEKSRIRIE
jgi:CRISPR-associated protein (TIGR02584 family)